MKINIFGMGYVGCVSAACLASESNDVTGIDIDSSKVSIINSGRSPIVEKGLEGVIREGIAKKYLRATTNNIPDAEVSIICVGTPSKENGSLDLQHIVRVSEQIGRNLKNHPSYHVVNVRSTVLPGTVENVVIPILTKTSGKKVGKDFGVCMNPEFMREGTSLHDYYNPPFTVIGQYDNKSGEKIAKIYKNVNAEIVRTEIKIAEMIKYSCNAFHAVKVSYGNEIGNICKKMGVDSHKVMEIFCKDAKLNLSPYYLKPGFAFGGSCLPKDVRALLYKAQEVDLDLPLLKSLIPTNQKQIDVAFDMIRKYNKKRIGILGLSFKAGTDDLRESPMVELVERLIGKGYDVKIYDNEVSLAKLYGANQRYINKMIPHVSTLLSGSMSEAFRNVDIIVIGNRNKDFNEYLSKTRRRNVIILDLINVNLNARERSKKIRYEGICW